MQQKKKKKPSGPPPPPPKLAPKPSVFSLDFKTKCIILALIGFFFYANSIGNEFALDDGIVIINNAYVQQGISGIPKILSTDAYDSYYKSMHASQMLAGGRYRPLSIVVFAVEQSLFNDSAQVAQAKADHKKPTASLFVLSEKNYWHVKHAINVLFYLACVLAIFYFLSKYLFKKMPLGEDMAFIAALLFAIHPMHTEVVANVKSLDEIISLLCIMGTCIYAAKYLETKLPKHLWYGTILYFLSLLAKEYAVMLIFILPVLFYTITDKKPAEILRMTIPYFCVFGLYMLIRIASVGIPHNVPSDEILNNPYMLAKGTQKMATEWYVLGRYLYMLFVPYPLSSDYSYAQIPYRDLSDISVLFSILIYLALGAWGVMLTLKRNILAFAVFFYLLNIAMVSNFLVDIGATMGERLAFHSSLGFVILVTYGLFKLMEKTPLSTKKTALAGVMGTLILACGAETVTRNAEWKNDVTLFTTDVHTVPNSVMVNGNAGARYIDLAENAKDPTQSAAYIHMAIECLQKSLKLHNTYTNSWLNLGVAYYKLNDPDSAKYCWDIAKKLYPDHPNLLKYYPLLGMCYLNKGMIIGKNKNNLDAAIQVMKKGIEFDPNNPTIWYNIGGAYYTIGKYDSAKLSWVHTLQLNPNFTDAQRGMNALPPQVKNSN